MFEFGRELKRILQPQGGYAPPRDGLTGGDPTLLELLDVTMLRSEAKAADVAAGRISARDRPLLHIRQAQVWRELARRTGDEDALRRAATAAETALTGLSRKSRAAAWAKARTEQALCAMLGAELFGDEGLNAAADFALTEASAAGGGGIVTAAADAARARLKGLDADAAQVRALAKHHERAMSLLEGASKAPGARLPAARARAERGEMLFCAGERLGDQGLISYALADLSRAASAIDAAYEPVTFARISSLRGQAMVALGESQGEPRVIAEGVAIIARMFEQLERDHSPLDWARGQLALAHGLSSLGEATDSTEAFDQALAAFDRALHVLRPHPALGLVAVASVNRALALARRAELGQDLFLLDGAEAALRCELAAAQPQFDPVTWAVCQLCLARIYETRAAITGRDLGQRAKAAVALSAAMDVFGEEGLRSLADVANEGLKRLRRG